jgi:hypothetical protein
LFGDYCSKRQKVLGTTVVGGEWVIFQCYKLSLQNYEGFMTKVKYEIQVFYSGCFWSWLALGVILFLSNFSKRFTLGY